MMLLPQRKKLGHEVPAWVDSGAVFFVTICCAERHANQLCCDDVARVLFEAVEFRQRGLRWYVHLLVLMPDHLHALVAFPSQEAMGAVVSNFKEATAKMAGVRWQTGFFDHRIRADESYDEKAAYIRANPVRAGLVDDNAKWPWVWEAGIHGGPSGPALPLV
jgi:putative transposase